MGYRVACPRLKRAKKRKKQKKIRKPRKENANEKGKRKRRLKGKQTEQYSATHKKGYNFHSNSTWFNFNKSNCYLCVF